jgi:hypothetical protein
MKNKRQMPFNKPFEICTRDTVFENNLLDKLLEIDFHDKLREINLHIILYIK